MVTDLHDMARLLQANGNRASTILPVVQRGLLSCERARKHRWRDPDGHHSYRVLRGCYVRAETPRDKSPE